MNNNFNYYTGVIGFPVLFVLLIWVVYWVEFKFDINLKIYAEDEKNNLNEKSFSKSINYNNSNNKYC